MAEFVLAEPGEDPLQTGVCGAVGRAAVVQPTAAFRVVAPAQGAAPAIKAHGAAGEGGAVTLSGDEVVDGHEMLGVAQLILPDGLQSGACPEGGAAGEGEIAAVVLQLFLDREERHFESVEALVAQIESDKKEALDYFGAHIN